MLVQDGEGDEKKRRRIPPNRSCPLYDQGILIVVVVTFVVIFLAPVPVVTE